MSLQILNAESNRRWLPTGGDWPLLIHGQPKYGASMFTVVLTAELIRRGERVIFLCAHGDAIRTLQTELSLKKPDQKYQAVSKPAVATLESMQLVTLLRKPGFDLLQSLRSLTDWSQRVVIVKNVHEVLTPQLWEVLKSHRHLVVSGDFDRLQDSIQPDFSGSTILFSPAPPPWPTQRTDQPRYIGEYSRGRIKKLLMVSDAPSK